MKVGEYVRTEKGILKIRDDRPFKDDKNKLNYLTYGNYTCVLKENIIKSSSNIIDLIERFDLANGHLVICKMYEDEKDIPTIIKCVGDYYFKNEDIKSIVTKEQFEAMKYEIK